MAGDWILTVGNNESLWKKVLFISSITGHFHFLCVKSLQGRNMGFKILRYSEAGSYILTWHELQ
jgi:hypothetical protein